MAASLLTADTLRLTNVPRLADIATMARLLAQHGVALGGDAVPGNGHDDAPGEGGDLELRAATIESVVAPYDLVRKMRASVLVLGTLVARVGQATVSLPGGCAIGPGPVAPHLPCHRPLSAAIRPQGGTIPAPAPTRAP